MTLCDISSFYTRLVNLRLSILL